MLGGGNYAPLGGGEGPQSAVVTEEVYTYVPEVREITEGKFPVRDTQLGKYKYTPSPFVGETLPAMIMALLSKLTGSVEAAFAAADFLFPPMTVWLIYWLSCRLGVTRQWSLLTAAAAVTATKFIELFPYPRPLWDYVVRLKGSDDFLFFSRNFHPQLSFLLFAGMLAVVIEALHVGGWRRIMVAGGLIGAQFYTYFFNWTATTVMLGILLVWHIWEGNWKLAKRLAATSLIGFIFSLLYGWEMLQFRTLPMYENFVLKNSLPAKSFIGVSARYLVMIFAVFWLTRRRRTLSLTVLIAAAMATILLPEVAQLFLGRDPEGKHWIRRLLMPLAFPLVAVFIGEVYRRQTWLKLKRRMGMIVARFGIVAVFLFGVRIQINASEKYAQWFRRSEEKQALFHWFNLNGKTGAAVATLDSGLVAEIPAFTTLDNVVPITTRSIATTDETLDRFLEVALMYQITPDDVEFLLRTDKISSDDSAREQELARILPDVQGSWVSRIFYFTANEGGQVFALPRQKQEEAVGAYRQRLEQTSANPHSLYRIDYILLGPKEKKLLGKDTLAGRFTRVYENGAYAVYQMEK